MFKDRIVAVMNKSVEPSKSMNALAQVSLTLGCGTTKELALIGYKDANGNKYPGGSKRLFVILKASSNKVKNLVKICFEREIDFRAFTESMTRGTWQEQTERTKEDDFENQVYYGVVIFGETEKVNELSKKFSLWKV